MLLIIPKLYYTMNFVIIIFYFFSQFLSKLPSSFILFSIFKIVWSPKVKSSSTSAYFFSDLFLINFARFFNSLSSGEYVNLTFLLLEGNIDWKVIFFHLYNILKEILSDDNADTFAASLLISYSSFSSLIFLSIAMIYYISLLKDFF